MYAFHFEPKSGNIWIRIRQPAKGRVNCVTIWISNGVLFFLNCTAVSNTSRYERTQIIGYRDPIMLSGALISENSNGSRIVEYQESRADHANFRTMVLETVMQILTTMPTGIITIAKMKF